MLSACRSLICKSTLGRLSYGSSRLFTTTFISQQSLVPSPERQAAAIEKQAPNRSETWAKSQKPRSEALSGPRILQRNLEDQPQPYAAINLIAKEPVRYINSSVAVCDGGRGVQGHPKIFVNLDKPGTHACQYCK